MSIILDLILKIISTLADVLPIVIIILFFQWFIIRKKIHNVRRVAIGFVYVTIGLGFFLVGLEKALFPLGKLMATQLTDPEFVLHGMGDYARELVWQDYHWLYIFAAMVGFASTIAEPALIAIAMKAEEVSGGAIKVWGLRIAVAVGVAVGISLGVFRIVTGLPLVYFIIAGYSVVVIQTFFTPKLMIALAFDSGGVTTSTVTVPLIAALGIGLASIIPGRSPMMDGFGLIALACLFPIITVMTYAQVSAWYERRKQGSQRQDGD